jgi:SAM-dependent methyltransferase
MPIDHKTTPSCPVCYSTGILYRQFEKQDLYRCSGCASLFYYPLSRSSWPSAYEPLESCPFYIERGANLLFYSEVIHYVNQVFTCSRHHAPRRRPNVLEVGCSYGFLMDIAQLLHNWNMKGVDPDPCAAQGREELGLDITQTRLEDFRADILYDAVVSVESIEHVEEPREHVFCMARSLCDDGFMLVTTPDASHSSLGPHLWPGEHYVIFSRDGLTRLLEEAGMRYCHFFATHVPEIMAVVAGKKPVPSEEIDNFQPVALEASIQSTTCYLLSRHESTHRSDLLKRGLHFRLFELLVNQGRYQEAQVIERKLDAMIQLQSGGAPFSDMRRYIEEMTGANDPMSYLHAGPSCLAPYLFYKGMLALNYTADYGTAQTLFGSAAKLFRKEVEQFDLTHFRVFLDAAESHQNLARSRAGEIRPEQGQGAPHGEPSGKLGFTGGCKRVLQRMIRKLHLHG